MKFIDLFAGLGGTRIGFEEACNELGFKPQCVFSSEIKPFAISTYKHNFDGSEISGDITKIHTNKIPDFDFLLGGFPCQPFSSAGSRHGFLDTRGTLFFEIERIIRDKKPDGFLLENVDGLVNHNKLDKDKPYGQTLKTIILTLEKMGYQVSWKVLNALDFGVPQNRKRVYIVGTKGQSIKLENFDFKSSILSDVLEDDAPSIKTDFVKKLLSYYTSDQLKGKSIKDKRGGKNNIHSWDIELKGKTTKEQRKLLSLVLKQRRHKKWAEKKGITWMDGMPLTLDEIRTFYDSKNLKEMLEDLVSKKYLRFEYPKDLFEEKDGFDKFKKVRRYATDKEKGYNIVTGKLSFEISKILNPSETAPTLVATDVTRMVVPQGSTLRRLTIREGLRLSGFPDWYNIDCKYEDAFDLLGNTVIVPVIKAVSEKILQELKAVSSARFVA